VFEILHRIKADFHSKTTVCRRELGQFPHWSKFTFCMTCIHNTCEDSQLIFITHGRYSVLSISCVVCWCKLEADRSCFMITINSIGTYLSPEERLKLCPRIGRLYPAGQIMLSQADSYENIVAVSQHYPVCTTEAVRAGCSKLIR